MARPKKKGLEYFPIDVDFFDDNKIKILRARYKSDGIAIYLYLLMQIYKNGYFLQIDDDIEFIISDDLGIDQNKVKQVLNFLLKRSLFNDILFSSDKVLTSAGIQRRFQLAVKERAKKNPIEVGRYWLLEEKETEPFIKCGHFSVNQGNTSSFSEKNSQKSQNNDTKKSKVNNYYINTFQADLEQAFQMYLVVRKSNYGEISQEQIQALRDDLKALSSDDAERIAIVKKATAGGWKAFYPIRKKSERKGSVKKSNGFNNFEGRKYDNMDDITRRVIE